MAYEEEFIDQFFEDRTTLLTSLRMPCWGKSQLPVVLSLTDFNSSSAVPLHISGFTKKGTPFIGASHTRSQKCRVWRLSGILHHTEGCGYPNWGNLSYFSSNDFIWFQGLERFTGNTVYIPMPAWSLSHVYGEF